MKAILLILAEILLISFLITFCVWVCSVIKTEFVFLENFIYTSSISLTVAIIIITIYLLIDYLLNGYYDE